MKQLGLGVNGQTLCLHSFMAQRSYVLTKLEKNGFKKTQNAYLKNRFEAEIALGQEIYSREADRFPCNIKIYVFVQFDDEQRLLTANALQQEHGCL